MFCLTYETIDLNRWFLYVIQRGSINGRYPREKDFIPPSSNGYILSTPLKKFYGKNQVGLIPPKKNPWINYFLWLRLNTIPSKKLTMERFIFDGVCRNIIWFNKKEHFIHFKLNKNIQDSCRVHHTKFQRAFTINHPNFWEDPITNINPELLDISSKCLNDQKKLIRFNCGINYIQDSNFVDEKNLKSLIKIINELSQPQLNKIDDNLKTRIKMMKLEKIKFFQLISDWNILDNTKEFNFDRLMRIKK